MIAERMLYRARQFWNALRAKPDGETLEEVRQWLNPSQWSLFNHMQPVEQAHSLQVYQTLIRQGETCPDLLVAALLHDAGKSRVRLRAWERALIVAAKAIFPARAKEWGSARHEKTLRSWKRPFIVAEQHPAWGAEMARQAGASPLTVALIRRHQESRRAGGTRRWGDTDTGGKGEGDYLSESWVERRGETEGEEDRLLHVLQSVDDES